MFEINIFCPVVGQKRGVKGVKGRRNGGQDERESLYATLVLNKTFLVVRGLTTLRRAKTHFFLIYFMAGSESRFFTQVNNFHYLIKSLKLRDTKIH